MARVGDGQQAAQGSSVPFVHARREKHRSLSWGQDGCCCYGCSPSLRANDGTGRA